MSEQKTQLPPSPEQMALDITTAMISAGYLKGVTAYSTGNLDHNMQMVKTLYKAALAEFKKG